ncbi:hypothetical protein [Maribellus mangrovi]|uniref:hypothetical protein n=1 Tax=Maribellus mangrovi TaxID=3133146 RepID=UPI0030EE3B8F
MSKINFDDIQENYKTALAEKEANTQDVVAAINDNDLTDKFTLIQKEKEQISSIEDLTKYQKKIKSFFYEVYKIITAPGVQKFIDWLDELSSNGLETKTRKYITEFLIKEYASYDNNIKNIIKNKDVVKSNFSLFEDVRKSVKENINKRIISSFTSNDKVEEEFPEFIEELNDLLEGLSKMKELSFIDIKSFYTNNLAENDNDDYTVEIDEKADFHFSIIKQVVEKKDFLTTNQENISLSSIIEHINSNIQDIRDSIEKLKTIDIQNEKDGNIAILYNKFEKNLVFDTEKNNISDYLEIEISGTWEKTITAYTACQDFYTNNPQAKVTKLNSNKDKWSSFAFASKIEQYVLTLNNIISDNPIKSINTNDISKIKTAYAKVEKSINSLEENNPKESILEFFSSITLDFEHKKIEILRKLKTEVSDVEKIEGAVEEIKSFIENIKITDNLLDALNDDFVDGILGSYDYIKKEFTSAIEKSDIKDDLEYLDEISSDEYLLSKAVLETNLERFKRLLEYDLININLTKNI